MTLLLRSYGVLQKSSTVTEKGNGMAFTTTEMYASFKYLQNSTNNIHIYKTALICTAQLGRKNATMYKHEILH